MQFAERLHLNAKIDVLKHIETPWHYHPELEITYVIKSTGRRVVGDNVENFSPEDMVLSGPKLPHVWINDKKYYQNATRLILSSYFPYSLIDSFAQGSVLIIDAFNNFFKTIHKAIFSSVILLNILNKLPPFFLLAGFFI